MVMHARSGGNLEVMGLMLGKVDGETMIIMDSFALPVEGTETRVNAQAAAYEYMAAYIENAKQVRRRRKLGGFTKERRRTKACRNTDHSIDKHCAVITLSTYRHTVNKIEGSIYKLISPLDVVVVHYMYARTNQGRHIVTGLQ